MFRLVATSCHFGAFLLWCYIASVSPTEPEIAIPAEQRLYETLMGGYEHSVRPVINASKIVVVKFGLKLNQIIDLDERHQILTTSVFIEQEWQDENLKWSPEDYTGVKTLRIPAKYVWLPDTFIFNNADDGSTGFMKGVYVILTANGTVIWPVPVKLKSSCKVDITYFPFDDQLCVLRFGSWIYSGLWMDFESTGKAYDLSSYIDNSEWELLSVKFKKNVRKYACCAEPHPDLTYTLHMRRRTFYYIFNIIVPCIMLSVLTLLTFWLPTTSGEKISLGLHVFLAFSMFMLLIAEEVPATSESVPLIGIYLTTVMTMTSTSVIMAVMVINLYNRGSKARVAPDWLKKLVFGFLSRFLCMALDLEAIIKTVKLEEEEENKYKCVKHSMMRNNGIRPINSPFCERRHVDLTAHAQNNALELQTLSHNLDMQARRRSANPLDKRYTKRDLVDHGGGGGSSHGNKCPDCDEEEVIWLRRSECTDEQTRLMENQPADCDEPRTVEFITPRDEMASSSSDRDLQDDCAKLAALRKRKEMIVEWHVMATVIDRLLFWIFLLGTVLAYIIILIVVPNTKPIITDEGHPLHGAIKKSLSW